MSVSIILTCYNEVPLIFDTYRKIVSVMNLANIEYEIIIVDDGTDQEQKKLLISYFTYFNAQPDTILLLSDKNEGRGMAIMKGIKASCKEYVSFIDTDLEISESYLLQLYKVIDGDGLDGVIGKRSYMSDWNINHWLRYIASRIYFLIANTVLNIRFLDTETGIKMFRRSSILPVLESIRNKRWFWDTEIIAESIKYNLKIAQVPVFVHKDKNKKSSVRVFRDTLRQLGALYKYQRRQQ